MVADVTEISRSLDEHHTRFLRVCAGGLAVLVAWLHLLHPEYGYEHLLRYIEYGTVYDPRPPLFVGSGLAIFAGIVLAFKGVGKRRVYLLGIALMGVYLLGYVAWHTVLDHGAFWPHIDPHHHDDVGLVESMVAHLQADTIAMVSKTAETVLLFLLAVLYGTDVE
ncbi:hypothetical protein [Natrarchaeobius chitinivorans]|uniref:Uncharacterized protein n=1 Tax=Natrarchaeobius chitinivorans TaxID=1679083 RepID=A0A3N6P024_NATCH|nr:hypothetical protein [Natrarchaeobius chitinivorans]RQG90679.1 hypothetical protein EA473_20440 [Natrarchaeobius chitinivorans]